MEKPAGATKPSPNPQAGVLQGPRIQPGCWEQAPSTAGREGPGRPAGRDSAPKHPVELCVWRAQSKRAAYRAQGGLTRVPPVPPHPGHISGTAGGTQRRALVRGSAGGALLPRWLPVVILDEHPDTAGLFYLHSVEAKKKSKKKKKPASKPDRGKRGHLQRIAEYVRVVLFTFVEARA